MNAPAIIQQRTLAQVLLDLREAVDDWNFALAEGEDAEDRASEADQRVDALRDEFANLFRASTGLTWGQIEKAVQEAVL